LGVAEGVFAGLRVAMGRVVAAVAGVSFEAHCLDVEGMECESRGGFAGCALVKYRDVGGLLVSCNLVALLLVFAVVILMMLEGINGKV
jgi:hypothetical protein